MGHRKFSGASSLRKSAREYAARDKAAEAIIDDYTFFESWNPAAAVTVSLKTHGVGLMPADTGPGPNVVGLTNGQRPPDINQ